MIGIICALKIEVDGLKALMENPEVTQKAAAVRFTARTWRFSNAAEERSTPLWAHRS